MYSWNGPMRIPGIVAIVVLVSLSCGLFWLAESPTARRTAIGRGEKHTIRVSLPAGQMVVVGVDQFEIDLTLSASYPGGRVVQRGDRGPYGRETLLFVTESGGSYSVNIEADPKGSLRGQYELNVI